MAEFTLNLEHLPFSLPYTLDSGQAFRWSQSGDSWYGVLGRSVLKVRQEGSSLVCSTSSDHLDVQAVFHYFGLDEDLERILASIMKDQRVTQAVQTFYGMRVMKQDIWECLLSFVIATNSNIPRIKGMISNICQRYGDEIEFDGMRFRLFPDAGSLAAASVPDLEACGLGYRAKFVKSISETIHGGWMSLEELRLHDYPRARELLTEEVMGKKTLMGIGPKVADCVLLFSCDKTSSFPIDVWMAKVLAKDYPHLFDEELTEKLTSKVSGTSSLSEATYDRLADAARGYFGEYAGYAQQYLFHHERMGGDE
jgi:N-glycosylase/DNA lyase